MAPLDQFILFGDSITQASNDQSSGFAFASELQAAYIRKLDVINRGYGGYNTDHGLSVIEHVIPTTAQASVRYLTIWFGANDCNREPLAGQYIPIEQYKENLLKIISHPLVKVQSPRIILITPPPVDEIILQTRFTSLGYTGVTRKAKDAADYAATVRDVGKEAGIPVVDVWTAFMKEAGWNPGDPNLPGTKGLPKSPMLADLLPDGLHLSGNGYRIVYNHLMEAIRDTWPEQSPQKLPFTVELPWEIARP